jgi:hypothetical protein
MSILSAVKLLTILALVSFAVTKQVKLQQFQLNIGDDQMDLTADDITFGFDGSKKSDLVFTYSRQAHVKDEIEECKTLLSTIRKYIVNASFSNNTLSFSLTAAEIVGKKMIRRGEFGDVYVLVIKNDKIKGDATMNVMTAKHADNADELFEDINVLFPSKNNLS